MSLCTTTWALRAGLAALIGLAQLIGGRAHAQYVQYIHTDALGSPVAVTDQSRRVVKRAEYEPYGKVLGVPVQDGPGYTGHVSDAATGLSYMQQRYYDPELGRFLSVDPVTTLNGGLLHFNLYAYGYSNPYKFTDPDGRCPICVPIVAGIFLYFTSGPANAPAPGERTESMPADEQILSAIPGGGRAAAAGRTVFRMARNVGRNSRDGARRQRQVAQDLQSERPNASVQNEQYLRNQDGTIARASDGTGRRVDHAVIENGRATTVETTSLTANKDAQIAKESEILNNGGTYVRDRNTRELVPVEGQSEIRRVPR